MKTQQCKVFQDKGPRPYLSEVRTLYDDFLFQNIDTLQKKGDATAIRQIIDEYKDSPYLTPSERTHLDELEFISEKADFELLKPTLTSSESLNLLKSSLQHINIRNFAIRRMHCVKDLFYNQSSLLPIV